MHSVSFSLVSFLVRKVFFDSWERPETVIVKAIPAKNELTWEIMSFLFSDR